MLDSSVILSSATPEKISNDGMIIEQLTGQITSNIQNLPSSKLNNYWQ